MKVKFLQKNIITGLMAIAVINCGKNENAVTFNDICQENDQADVQLSGFLV